MPDRKLFGLFTGTHVTALALGVLFVSVALGAGAVEEASSLQHVFVTNSALVVKDSASDPYAHYAAYGRDPKSTVDIAIDNSGLGCETAQVYTPPSGSSLIITALSGTLTQAGPTSTGSASREVSVALWASPGCQGTLLTSWSNTLAGTTYGFTSPISAQYPNGIVLPSGSSLSVFSYFNTGTTFIHGFLVPASSVPAAGSWHGRAMTSAAYAAKLARH